MNLDFKVTNRKDLVKALGEITNSKPKYMGPPTFAYAIGDEFRVDKEGALELPDDYPAIDAIVEQLKDRGFVTEDNTQVQDASNDEDTLTIKIPKDYFTKESLENLRKIVDSKGTIMKHAFNTSSLPILEENDEICFPWFTSVDSDSTKAYTHFISAICNMAKMQKRITAREREVESEKYAFRCFLLRLGFSGKEYKTDRKILLKNLDGPAAFPSKEAADKHLEKVKEEQ